MTVSQVEIQMGMVFELEDIQIRNWGSGPSLVLVHKVHIKLQAGSMSSSSFFAEEWGITTGHIVLPQPRPDLSPVGPYQPDCRMGPGTLFWKVPPWCTMNLPWVLLPCSAVAADRWFLQEPLRHRQVIHHQRFGSGTKHRNLEISVAEYHKPKEFNGWP